MSIGNTLTNSTPPSDYPSNPAPVATPHKPYYNKMIYVAGAYGGSETNKNYIEMCCRRFSEDYPTYCFINGVSEFSHWYNKSNSIVNDLKRCVFLLKKCDEMWVLSGTDWESSQGTMVEIFVAMENDIPVVYDKDKQLSIKKEK